MFERYFFLLNKFTSICIHAIITVKIRNGEEKWYLENRMHF
jgi:hypothetical protein